MIARQNLPQIVLQVAGERVNPEQVKYIAMFFEAELKQGYRLVLDKPFAIQAEHRWRLADQDLIAEALHELGSLYQCVGSCILLTI